jgi:hypothetical protein
LCKGEPKVDKKLTIFFKNIKMTRVEIKVVAIVILNIFLSTICHFNTHFLVVFVRESWYPMFSSFNFGIAQNPCIVLHCATSFGRVSWQSCNMPMERQTINL